MSWDPIKKISAPAGSRVGGVCRLSPPARVSSEEWRGVLAFLQELRRSGACGRECSALSQAIYDVNTVLRGAR